MFFHTLRRIGSIQERHAGKTYTPESFTHLLRCQFRDPNLKFGTIKKKNLKVGAMQILGEYRPAEDEYGDPCIFINFVYSSNWKKIKIEKVNWCHLAFSMADVITHEYLHQFYIRNRNYQFGRGYRSQHVSNKYNESLKEYLGCEDEILAYGFSVAAESVFYERPIEKTKIYKKYARCFKDDLVTVKKLKRQAVKYIKILESYYHDKIIENRARRTTRSLRH